MANGVAIETCRRSHQMPIAPRKGRFTANNGLIAEKMGLFVADICMFAVNNGVLATSIVMLAAKMGLCVPIMVMLAMNKGLFAPTMVMLAANNGLSATIIGVFALRNGVFVANMGMLEANNGVFVASLGMFAVNDAMCGENNGVCGENKGHVAVWDGTNGRDMQLRGAATASFGNRIGRLGGNDRCAGLNRPVRIHSIARNRHSMPVPALAKWMCHDTTHRNGRGVGTSAFLHLTLSASGV
jgi:hypothetical protein